MVRSLFLENRCCSLPTTVGVRTPLQERTKQYKKNLKIPRR